MAHHVEHPHAKTAEELYALLETSRSGLSAAEAAGRLASEGANELTEERRSPLSLLIGQFESPIAVVLLIAAAIAYAMKNTTDAWIIVGILCLNALLGFVQEYRAETSIRALRQLTETHVRAVRMGMEVLIPSREVVRGDILVLAEGDLIPADLRLIEAHALQVDESILTGESLPASKRADTVLPDSALPYERENSLFSGTHVLKGSAVGISVATGSRTYLSRIAQSAQEASPHSPLTRSLALFSKRLLGVLVAVLALVGIVGIVQGRTVGEMASIVIAELVSAVPEGLPIVVTLVLALGAYRLSRHKVLVRHLPSVEALGSATVIATDKTGTITEGFLSVRSFESADSEALKLCAALCNDGSGDHGDPVDTALARWVGEEYASLRATHPRLFFHPFDASRRLMATVNRSGNAEKLYVKGAFESLRAMADNAPETLGEFDRYHDAMASQGLRVLAFGIGEGGWEDPERWTIRIIGVVGFADGVKADAAEAVRLAREAGIRIMMVTGDNPVTARVIAREVGIWKEGDTLLSGTQIEAMSDEELSTALRRCTLIARALPEHKYRTVKRLQHDGEIVAVTGDGVNDVPALKAADLGIAMGSGSEAAKSTAKMVVTDNAMGVIVDAIRQGRIITANLRKVIFYLLATCFDEILIISGAIMAGLPLPLHPTQILWINVVTDGVLDKTFPMCREEGDVMHRPPRRIETQLFDRWQIFRIVWVSIVNASVALGMFAYLLYSGHPYVTALTVSFCIIVASQWVNGILAQKEEEPFLRHLRSSLTINPALWVGIFLGIALQAVALYVVPEWFHVEPPGWEAAGHVALATAMVFLLIEGYKWGEWRLRRSYGAKGASSGSSAAD